MSGTHNFTRPTFTAAMTHAYKVDGEANDYESDSSVYSPSLTPSESISFRNQKPPSMIVTTLEHTFDQAVHELTPSLSRLQRVDSRGRVGHWPSPDVGRHPSTARSSNERTVVQPSKQLRYPISSLRSYDSNLSTGTSSSVRDRYSSSRERVVSQPHQTERPKQQKLFEYIGWDGRPSATPVKCAPPVSFNRYLRNPEQPIARTDTRIDPSTGGRVGAYANGRLNDLRSYSEWDALYANETVRERTRRELHRATDSQQLNEMLVAATKRTSHEVTDSEQLRAWKDEVKQEIEVRKASSKDVTNPKTPAVARPLSEATETLLELLPPESFFYQHPGARVCGHARNESNSSAGLSTDSKPSSVRTDKLPSVTNPAGISAYYGRYLDAASSLAKSADSPKKLYVNKPLPPIPTLRDADATARQAFNVMEHAFVMGTATMPLTSREPEAPPVCSYFSDSEDEVDDADVKIREIDPKQFGRAKHMSMRPGMDGWEAYRSRMLEESRGGSGKKPVKKGRMRSGSWLKGARKLSYCG